VEGAGQLVGAVQDRVAVGTAAVFVDGDRVGSAVLVDGRYLLTARHVVSEEDETGWGPPADLVTLVFPGVRGGEVTATPVVLPHAGAVDVAVLDLGKNPPGWLPAPLGLWSGRRLPERVVVLGFPAAEEVLEGVWREFTTSGTTSSGLVQLDWAKDVGTLPGHSGGPVVDHDSGCLAGILVQGAEKARFDRFVPVTLIERCWPGLRRPWLFAGLDARSHIRRRALGQRSRVQGGDLFQGRVAALAKIGQWLVTPQCPQRPLVLTALPGAGKSAVLGRAALAAEQERPGAGLVFHARGATHAEFLDAIAASIGAATLDSQDNLLDVLGAQETDELFAVMLDALDEAATAQERRALAQTLSELARIDWLRVVVATRPLASGDRYSPGSLLPMLGVTKPDADNLVDLDVDPYNDPDALRVFAAALLAQEGATRPGPAGRAWQSYRDDPALRARTAAVIAQRADRNFLVAAMTSVPLSVNGDVADPDAPGFDPKTLPASVGEALDKHLDSIPDSRAKAENKGLLTALAFARGAGISDGLWLRFARALGYTAAGQVDLDVLRDTAAADYLLQSVDQQSGQVARLFHQALVDELLSGRGRADHQAVYSAVLADVDSSGGWAGQSRYGRAHAAEHADAAGQLLALINDPDYLSWADLSRLLPLLPVGRAAGDSPAAAVLRRAAARAAPLPAPRRARLLALTAAHLGFPNLRQSLCSVCNQPPTPLWAHTLGEAHQELAGHTGPVRAVAVGRLDGRDVVVSGSDDETVRIWDGAGAPVCDPLTGHTSSVFAVAVGRLDGRDVVVSGSYDETVRIWDGAGAPVGAPLTGHTSPVRAVAVGRLDGHDVVVSGSNDHTVRIWDGAGAPVGNPLTGYDLWVGAMAVGRLDGHDVVVAGSNDHTVRIWDGAGAPVGSPLTGHDLFVGAMAVGRLDGRDVVVCRSNGHTVRIWDGAGAPVGAPLTGHTSWVGAVAVGRLDGRDVVVSGGGSGDGTVRIWDGAGAPVGEPLTHHSLVYAVAVGRLDGRDVIVSGGFDGTVRIWDGAGAPVGDPLTGHNGPVNAVAVGQLDGRDVIVSSSDDHTVRIWDGAGAPVGDPLTGHTDRVNAVAVGRLDGRDVIVSGSDDETVRIWDGSGCPLTHIDLLAPCSSLCMTTDRIYIASGRAISVFTSS
jgi:WD40 repeat protein/V8-like Glu-specific endopeptidase